MKKFTMLLFATIVAGFAYCQVWLEFMPSESIYPICTVLTSTDTLVEFEVLIPGMFVNEVDSFQRVIINDHTVPVGADLQSVPRPALLYRHI